MENVLSARAFYDSLANDYHLIFEDWWEAAANHGEIIDRILRDLGVQASARILDCTCGIGTQALALAVRGYRVLGTDVSAAAVARARQEAGDRDIAVDFAVCDVRELRKVASLPFDCILACDNSLAHLLAYDDLLAALRSIRSSLTTGGIFLASIREYDEISRERPTGVMPATFSSNGGGRIVGQAWQWSDQGDTLLVRLFILQENQSDWSCSVATTRLRAWHQADVGEALLAAGFGEVDWRTPDDTDYYQPIITARAT